MAGGDGIAGGEGISIVASPPPSVGGGASAGGDTGVGEGTVVSMTVVSVRTEVVVSDVVDVDSSPELPPPQAVNSAPAARQAANPYREEREMP